MIPLQYFTAIQFAVKDLHVFADASSKVYGEVSYLLQSVQLHLIGHVRTGVVPLKMISLPRLELMAAVLATRLATFILLSMKCQCNVYL